jgi:hypothetical protein
VYDSRAFFVWAATLSYWLWAAALAATEVTAVPHSARGKKRGFCRFLGGLRCPELTSTGCYKSLIGEMAERSKALDWNSSNIFTGVRGFESHSLRHFFSCGGPYRLLRDDQS